MYGSVSYKAGGVSTYLPLIQTVGNSNHLIDFGNFEALNDNGMQGNTHRLLEAIEQQKRAVEMELARLKDTHNNSNSNSPGNRGQQNNFFNGSSGDPSSTAPQFHLI